MVTPECNKSPEFRILHLYYDLMNLYGDWANAEVLARELEARGFSVTLEKKSAGHDVDFEICDFVYIGSGTERSQYACLRYISEYKETILARIEDGMHVLTTGNSHEMFGRFIRSAGGKTLEALGLLDFETVHENSRVTGDCVCKASFLEEKLIGFINKAGGTQRGNVERPFQLEMGPSGSESSRAEGIIYKNLLGTYLTGPILVRNPPLLKHYADKLCKTSSTLHSPNSALTSEYSEFAKFQKKAYQMALKELEARKQT